MLAARALHEGWTFYPATRDAMTIVGHSSRIPNLPAQVPGHVHTDLVRNGVIQDPFYRMGELGAQWVDETDWEYRLDFDWTPAEGRPRRVLRFEGLDTLATIRLNDEVIATSDNMFIPVEVDVTDRLAEGANTLIVTFTAAARVGRQRKAEYFAAQGIADNAAQFFDRSFVRKAQYMYGWDWGPRLVSCGLWRAVSLIEYATRIRLLNVNAELKIGTPNQGVVTVRTDVEGDGATPHHSVVDAQGRVVAQREGDGELVVNDPTVWGIHQGNLYTLRTELRAADGTVVDATTRRIGFRTIRVIQEPDAHGVSFAFEINGRRTWIRGANWIPDHSLPSQTTMAELRAELARAKAMGMNLLRVWGGGVFESDDFYDACDEAGMLVWQDFPYGCAYYPDTDEWQAVAEVESRVNIQRLRHRASLAIWCGNNENQTMWDSAWGGMERRPARLYGDHLYHEVIPRVLGEEDPGRPYIYSSPFSLEGHGHANADATGDSHYWDVWHGRGDWIHYQDSHTRFSSEFGFVSSPSLEVWRDCLAPRDRGAHTPAVQWHDKTGKGYATYLGLVQLHYPTPVSLEDLVYTTQANQRDAIRFALEHYRTNGICEGTVIWQLNDCWPVQSWALEDCKGVIKPAGWELQRVYADAMLAVKLTDGTASVWVVNDGDQPISGSVRLQAWSLSEGRVVADVAAEVVREPNQRAEALRLDVGTLNGPDTVLIAEMDGVRPTFRLLVEPKDLVAPTVPIQAKWLDAQTLQLSASRPVVDLWLYDDQGRTSEPALTTLLPDAPAIVHFPSGTGILQARSLAGAHALVF